MAKIFVSMPCTGGMIHQKTVLTLPMITQKHELVYKFIENCSLITKGRQDHFGMFLKSDCDYLLSVDADEVLGPPGILDHMIENCPPDSIIGGVYAMKALKPDGTAPLNGGALDNKEIKQLDGSIIPMSHIPTGFMLTPRPVAEKMAAAYANLAYEDHIIGKTYAVYNCILKKDPNGIVRYYPEDFSYCERAKAIGIKIFADSACMIGHIGSFMYHLEHLRK
jgi:hypothetical protein